MLPNKVAFILYTPILGSRVRMGNNSFASIARKGSAIISLNSKKILICNCLHIPDLRNPLYSLHISASVDAGTFACMALGCMYSSLASSLKLPQPPTATSGIILWDVYEAWQTLTTFSQNTHHRLQPLHPLPPHQSRLNLMTPIFDNNAAPTYAAHWLKRPPSPLVDQFDLSTLPAETKFTKPLNEMSREELITLLHDSSSPPTTESTPLALPKRKAANLLT
jgi:hypothetical protein